MGFCDICCLMQTTGFEKETFKSYMKGLKEIVFDELGFLPSDVFHFNQKDFCLGENII